MKDVIKIKKPNQVSNVKVSHEASSFYADLSKQWAIKLDKPIENNEYSSKFYAKISEQNADSAQKSANSAKEVASNLERIVTNSLYFPELKISNEDVILNKLEREKRSTFDKSKFTVVGSPTITDDGVASGFKKGNDLNFPAITVTDNSTIVIRTKIKTVPRASSSDTQGQCIFGFYKNGTDDLSQFLDAFSLWNGTNITLSYRVIEGEPTQAIAVRTAPNTEYEYKVEITKNAIKCYLDGELKGQLLNLSFDMSLINNVIGSIGTGARKGLTPTRMKIYLPDFSITVDGKEVFSGNKTGIDTIKADNYEVVGSPVISDDGVASGFSVANYIKSNTALAFTAGQTWKIDLKVNIKNSESGIDKAQCLFQIYASNPSLNSLQAILYNNRVFWTCPTTPSGGATNRFLQFTSEFNISSYLNQDIWFKFIYNGTQYIFEWSADGINFTREVASTDSRQFTGTGTLNLGAMSIHQQGLQGSIDLNDTKVYINDDLAYQPCLKIPYTQSKTGSKIADGVYRDRVQDMYEQYGYTHYYTLGDTDFTLATCKGSDVVESGDNYEQTADLTLKQWGSATSGQTVNLLPYKDTNYAVTLANGSKTKSSFVANASGDYLALGKTVLG